MLELCSTREDFLHLASGIVAGSLKPFFGRPLQILSVKHTEQRTSISVDLPRLLAILSPSFGNRVDQSPVDDRAVTDTYHDFINALKESYSAADISKLRLLCIISTSRRLLAKQSPRTMTPSSPN